MTRQPIVLVVEPEPARRKAISCLVVEMGCQPWAASAAALAPLKDDPGNVEVAVCDWESWLAVQEGPVGQGNLPAYPPVVLVAEAPAERERELALWVGAFEMVEPPLDELARARMRQVLMQALAASRERRAELLRRGA